MSRSQSLLSLQRRLCAWDLEPRRAEVLKLSVEQQLRFLPHTTWYRLNALDDPGLLPCDLLVVYAWHLAESELLVWLKGFEKRLVQQSAIWVPALIITPIILTHIEDLLEKTLRANWYFDLLHPDHFSSLPVRVANLLRIHDHLHEMRRYEKEMATLQSAVLRVESELDNLRKGSPK